MSSVQQEQEQQQKHQQQQQKNDNGGAQSKQQQSSSSNSKHEHSSTSAVTFLAGDACRYPAVRAAAARMGWRLIGSGTASSSSNSSSSKAKQQQQHNQQQQQQNCNILWVDISILADYFLLIQPWQCINHFPGMVNIARKTRLAQNLESMKRKFPSEYDFFPLTFALPKDFTTFRSCFFPGSDGIGSTTGGNGGGRQKSKTTWIIKPDGGAKGKGIFLTRDLSEIQSALQQNGCSYVAQRYIRNPMLIESKKFDLRLYVLITSVEPNLRIYLFRDGLCRLCTVDYCKPGTGGGGGKNLKDRCAHLTNYSVNKKSAAFVRDDGSGVDGGGGGGGVDDSEDDTDTGEHGIPGGDCGSKRSVSWLLSWLRQEHGDDVVDTLWCNIGDICVKTIISILPTLVSEYRATFGGDESDEKCSTGGGGGGLKGSRCFEILGFDIMLDDKLKPHLIEVNHLPSFGTDAPLDKAIKSRVIEQAMGVVQAKANDRKVYEKSQRQKSRHRLVAGRRRTASMMMHDPCEDSDLGDSRVDEDVVQSTAQHRQQHILPPTAESILTTIYKEHAPDKLDKIPSMLIKYRGYEEWLIAKVRERYCSSRDDSSEDSEDDEPGEQAGSFGGRLDCSRDDVAAAGKCHNTQEEERGYMYTNASENKQWAEEEEILKDYERIYPPQPQNKRPLRIPPYKAMEEHAFQENAKQVERLTVPLHQSRAGGDQADQNDGDTTNRRLGEFAPSLSSHPSRADSWISGSLHLRRASAPIKIRHPPTKKQIESFDRLSRGYHANEDADNAPGGDVPRSESKLSHLDVDPFNASLELAEKEASLLSRKRWDTVRRVRQELDEAKERRQRNEELMKKERLLSVAVRSLDLGDLGSPLRIGGDGYGPGRVGGRNIALSSCRLGGGSRFR